MLGLYKSFVLARFFVKVDSYISEENIEKALHVEPPSRPAYDRFVERFRRGLDSYVPPEKGWRLPPIISREESQPMRAALISSHLRAMRGWPVSHPGNTAKSITQLVAKIRIEQ